MITIAVFGALGIITVLAVRFIVIPLIDKPEGTHHAPSRRPRLARRAARRARATLRGARSWFRREWDGLADWEPAEVIAWLRVIGLHPGWNALTIRRQILVLDAFIRSAAPLVAGAPDGGVPGPEPEPREVPVLVLAPGWEHDTGWFTFAAIDADALTRAGA